MIKFSEPPARLEPENPGYIQWGPALLAGFLVGAIFLFVPRGSPWSSVTFFDPLIMGRAVPARITWWISAWLIHLSVSIIYGLIISWVVSRLRVGRAILTGGLMGLFLYGVNLLMVSLFIPQLRGNEMPVLFTHVVFSLTVAGAYRGLLKRKPAAIASVGQ
jgi:hypothetical protein